MHGVQCPRSFYQPQKTYNNSTTKHFDTRVSLRRKTFFDGGNGGNLDFKILNGMIDQVIISLKSLVRRFTTVTKISVHYNKAVWNLQGVQVENGPDRPVLLFRGSR